jgi:hypothetical protein
MLLLVSLPKNGNTCIIQRRFGFCKYGLFLLALKSLLRSKYSLTLFLQHVQRMSTISPITCEAREDATNRFLWHLYSGQLRGKFYQAAGKFSFSRGSKLAWHVTKGLQ